MKTSRAKISKILIALGIVLIILPAAIFGGTAIADNIRFSDTAGTVSALSELMPDITPGAKDERYDPSMPRADYNGNDYVGILKIGENTARLPVLSAKISGAAEYTAYLHSGSAYNGTLIIGGGSSLACLAEISANCPVSVTDMRGACFTYTAAEIHHADRLDINRFENKGFDCIIYCKRSLFSDYVIVCCK